MAASSRYVVRNLWNVAPVLTTNLVSAGLVDPMFNATLTRSAVTAFDEYTSVRRGTSCRSSPAVGGKESNTGAATTGTRRRRRTPSTRQENTMESSTGRSKGPVVPPGNHNCGSSGVMTLTDNDFFFEHQKTRGYRLASHSIANCECTERLQEDYLVTAVAYYLDTVCGAKPLSDLLFLGTGELSIDIWAAVQRGKVIKINLLAKLVLSRTYD